MTQPAPAARRPNLPAAIRALRAAIDRMVKPSQSYLNNTHIEVPGLYLQLSAAICGQQGSGNGLHARSLPPVWVDAADQLNNIDLMVSVWPTGSAGDTLRQLRALSAKTWTVDDAKTVRRLAGIINAWADDIETLLNHDHVKYINGTDGRPAPCPACGTDTIEKRDSAGELIRTPALQIVTEKGCTCVACGYVWEPKHYLDLIDQLGFDRPEGVLA